MTLEEKQLLLKDLSARLPYGVIMQMNNHNYLPTKLRSIDIDKKLLEIGTIHDVFLDACKPYLRSISSMTDEEKIDYRAFFNYDGVEYPDEYIDWLNKNMFDYRGLIEKGLAIEVTKENNPYI